MSRYFAPYEGSAPYVFVSYSHVNSPEVLDVITELRRRCWRIWYDEGIPAGSDWPRNIAEHMAGCSAVLFFWSATAKTSPNCASEIREARRMGKPVLWLPLDTTVADGAWDELSRQAEHVERAEGVDEQVELVLSSAAIDERFLGTEADYERSQVTGAAGSRWNLATVATFAFLVASVVAFVGLATGLIALPGAGPDLPEEPDAAYVAPQVVDLSQYGDLFADVVDFPDATQARAVKQALGLSSGDSVTYEQLADITSLYLCGNVAATSMDAVAFDMDGSCRVNGAPVIEGEVSDLSAIARMPYLTELALIEQPADDLSDLAGLVLLHELWLGGSEGIDLSTLPELPSLESLHLEHTVTSDLSPLSAQPALRRVYVSADMLPLDVDTKASFVLVLAR